MKKVLKYIFIYSLCFLVLLLSFGIHISKMKCDESGRIYLGNQVPSCIEENKNVCATEQESVSCCIIEFETSCCPETKDDSCASETENIQFDFETLLNFVELDFSSPEFLTSTFNRYYKEHYFLKGKIYFSGIPPPNIHKPELSELQTFLL